MLFEDLLLTKPQVVAVLGPPPRHGPVVRVGILRRQDERRHEFDEVRLRAFEPGVVQFIEVHHLRILQVNLAVAVVPLAAELDVLQHILAEREHCRVIGMDAPFCRLLLLPLVLPATHDGLMSVRRMSAMNAEIVRIQRVPRAGIEKPRMHRLPLEEEVVVGLNVGQAAPRSTGRCPTDCVPRGRPRAGRARRLRD